MSIDKLLIKDIQRHFEDSQISNYQLLLQFPPKQSFFQIIGYQYFRKVAFQIIIFQLMLEKSYCKKVLQFILYTLLIYVCYISSGVYHQKILKHKYVNDHDGTQEYFQAPIAFTFFPQIVCIILGFAILKYNHWGEEGYQIEIPAKKSIVCSAVINLNMWTYNKAVITASFPAVVMVKSCSLLSVILIAIFCSRVKDKTLKLGTSKIWIGILVTIGIILFNYFKVSEGATDKSITLVSCALLFVSLLGDGILPDLQAEIKSLYKPSVMEMYFTINKYTALIALVYAIVTFQVTYIVNFIIDHSELQHDLLYFSILNAFGQLIVYRMIKLFKQHIPSFVIATRKCFTVIVNIIHFGHKINMLQGIGMSLVFFAVMVEVYQNYKERQSKEEVKQIKQIEIEDERLQNDLKSDDLQVLDSKNELR